MLLKASKKQVKGSVGSTTQLTSRSTSIGLFTVSAHALINAGLLLLPYGSSQKTN